MVEVAGQPLLDHARQWCGSLRTVVNTHYFADQVIDHLEGTGTLISDETDQLLETGGGLKRAQPLLDSNPVFTMNTDAVWRGTNPLDVLGDAWRPEMEALLLLIPKASAVAHAGSGDFDLNSARQVAHGTEFVYSGAQIIRTDLLVDITDQAFSMWALWDGMLERGSMFGAVYDGAWCDVGRPGSIPKAEAMLDV
jgi:MurNAc alpha-1-phosphate uridylyltransferase